jgi:hypothetical protein
MDAEELVSIADAVYSEPIDSFTASRNDRAAAAKRSGAADLAAAVRAFRKPSPAAWALNMLVRHSADALSSLASLRSRIDTASLSGNRDDLRAASRERHDLVSRLLDDARSLAADAGRALSASVSDELSDALLATLGDAVIAEAVATARLVEAPRSGGMSSAEIRALVALPPDALAPDLDDGDADADETGANRTGAGARRIAASDRKRGVGRSSSSAAASTAQSRTRDASAESTRTRRRLERELVAAEEADAAAREDRARREARRVELTAHRDELREEVTRRGEALRDAQRGLDDAEDRLDALAADIGSRELEWKRAEATVRRARQSLDGNG